MKVEIEVLKPGLFSTVQDLGRFGTMEYGVPLSGAMDHYGAKMANLILQNSADCAVLEITQMGPKLKFSGAINMVISGADLSPRLNKISIENNKVIVVQEGDVLDFGKRLTGSRAYLAVSGGFKTAKMLGSRSWYEGITSSYRLDKGMVLEAGTGIISRLQTYSSLKVETAYLKDEEISCFPGPEFKELPRHLQEGLFQTGYTVSRNYNRMAVQLAENFQNDLEPIITGPVLPGTVQLTPGGKLIILMRDCQTTGGYPRVLQLSERAMDILGQKVEGDRLIFTKTGEVAWNG